MDGKDDELASLAHQVAHLHKLWELNCSKALIFAEVNYAKVVPEADFKNGDFVPVWDQEFSTNAEYEDAQPRFVLYLIESNTERGQECFAMETKDNISSVYANRLQKIVISIMEKIDSKDGFNPDSVPIRRKITEAHLRRKINGGLQKMHLKVQHRTRRFFRWTSEFNLLNVFVRLCGYRCRQSSSRTNKPQNKSWRTTVETYVSKAILHLNRVNEKKMENSATVILQLPLEWAEYFVSVQVMTLEMLNVFVVTVSSPSIESLG